MELETYAHRVVQMKSGLSAKNVTTTTMYRVTDAIFAELSRVGLVATMSWVLPLQTAIQRAEMASEQERKTVMQAWKMVKGEAATRAVSEVLVQFVMKMKIS